MSTPEFLQQTLEANLQFQAQVFQELERIAKRKAENRRQAARLVQHVVATWDHHDEVDHQEWQQQLMPFASSPEKKLSVAKKKWAYDPYRRWTRRYFVDPLGTFPSPNADVVRRRQLEQQQVALSHTNAAPWTVKETKLLQNIVSQLKQQQQQPTTTTTTVATSASSSSENRVDDHSLDFDEVAALLELAHQKDKKRSVLLLPRSEDDCRLQLQHSQKLVPFTKKESLYILEQVHLHPNKQPNWSRVASTLNQQQQQQQQQQEEQKSQQQFHHPRTAWQCLCHYQSKLVSTLSTPWTPQEDELLFWYLAAMGPQFLLGLDSAAHMSSRLFPDKAPAQILTRANQSLLNPNFDNDYWSDDDQRKLVLCMKVYRDTPSPSIKAAAHFPHRAEKSVSEKWTRSLNPEFTSRPFTPQEDQALLEAVRSNQTWSDIATHILPQFQLQRLYRRWRTLASDVELAKHGNQLKRKEGAKRGLVTFGDDALLHPDDFVLQVKKKKPRR